MIWDVVIIGGGPGGMQAAIAAASEGLKVLVLEKDKVGGQIGQTPKLENSVFAPAGGMTGPDFAAQMKSQAHAMGVTISEGVVVGIYYTSRSIGVQVRGMEDRKARTVILAMGSAWHNLDIPGLKPQVGKTVHYGPVQCLTVDCVGQEVAVFGGGPSAGQAIIELAHRASKVHVLMRSTLKMPQYLVDRIHALPNIQLWNHTKINAVIKKGTQIRVAMAAGTTALAPLTVNHLFMCAGLTPATKWLLGVLDLDDGGRILVGQGGNPSLQTSMDGVFAVGDCRSGSTPRVGVAIGDGSLAVTQIWDRFMANPVCVNCKTILA